jgi:hypothetical protein
VIDSVTAEELEGFWGFVIGAEKKKDLEVQKYFDFVWLNYLLEPQHRPLTGKVNPSPNLNFTSRQLLPRDIFLHRNLNSKVSSSALATAMSEFSSSKSILTFCNPSPTRHDVCVFPLREPFLSIFI